MGQNTPTTQSIYDKYITSIEGFTNQETPSADRSYNKAQASSLSMFHTSLAKYAAEKTKECLTISASLDGLEVIGQGYGIPRKPAESAVIIFDVPALNGTTIGTDVIYKSLDTGVEYRPDAPVTAGASNIATITATATTAGAVGNLNNGQTVEADRTVSGAEKTGTVTGTVTVGADAEGKEAYRTRLLDFERTEGGGSNAPDHRRWGQAAPGVARIFPYTGNKDYLQTGTGTIKPVNKTIFVEADSSIDPDGVAPQALLDTVRSYIRFDPDTTRANEALTGDINDLMEIASIFNSTFFVVITNLDVSGDVEAQVKADIESNLKIYFRTIRPFILGLDFVEDRNDRIDVPGISSIVTDVVRASGGSFKSLTFNQGAGTLEEYFLTVGELVKLADTGGVSYVTT
jgi:uncharacterized phage protein gp47/JayE